MSDFQVKTEIYQPHLEMHQEMVTRYREAAQDSNNRLAVNYQEKNILKDNIIAVSIARDQDDFFAISNTIHRPLFGNGTRVANRCYHKTQPPTGLRPDRMNLEVVCRESTARMVDQQVEIAEKLGYDFMFLSREGAKPDLFKKVWQGLLKLSQYKDWKFDENQKYVVCNGGKPPCQQWVIWRGRYLGLKKSLLDT